MSLDLIPCPPSLKAIQHYLKAAQEHEGRDVVVCYWCRLYALQVGLKLSTHQQDETKLLMGIMEWLESAKKENGENESITNEVAAQAHLENYALKLFLYADKQDRESNFGKNVVKAFYTSGIVYDVLQTFGELTEEAAQNRKYAKWKAAYIHNCLKNGETPVPGPMANEEGADDDSEEPSNNTGAIGGLPTPPQQPSPLQPQPPPNPYSQPQTPSTPQPGQSHLTADEVLRNPDRLPKPPVDEEKHPGGFIPFVPPQHNLGPQNVYVPPKVELRLTPEQITKAQKYCKYAGSALNYDDVKTAIENLQSALRLLTSGQE